MSPVTLPRLEPAQVLRVRPGSQPCRDPAPDRRTSWDPVKPALALLLLLTFLLRIWGIKQGLPYVYNVDEATHFVPKAIGFFGHDLNPHYFLNPPAYSYVLHFLFDLWFGGRAGAAHAYSTDPTSVFVIARVVAALLGTIAVWLTYLAGTRLFGRAVGLTATAIFGLAFLPIFYSHLALNDVPTLAPVALALYGIAGVVRRARLRDYVTAGIGVGLASATKYTGGVVLVSLLAASLCDSAADRAGPALRRLAAGLLVALGVFLLANPYALLAFGQFGDGVSAQASLAAGSDPVKLGAGGGSGISYYLWSFTWGLGWVPSLAALGGSALLLARKRVAMALVLLPVIVVFIVFMGVQQRYFGRWLMPIFPIVSVLGGYGAVELVRAVTRAPRARRVPPLLVGALVGGLLLAQSVVTVIHNDAVLSRPDTRNLTRAWMVAHVPAGARVVIEPQVPDDWATDIGSSLPWTGTGERWYRYPTWVTDVDTSGRALPGGRHRFVLVDQYERTLRPALIDEYLRSSYCWVVVGSLQEGRALAQPRGAPSAIAYYAALRRRAALEFQTTPFSPGVRPVPFNFDWSIDYYPSEYRRPGPQMSVYRLSGGRCGTHVSSG